MHKLYLKQVEPGFDHQPWLRLEKPRYLEAVRRLTYCTRCGFPRPVEAAHYSGRYGHLFGRGRSRKCSDHLTAALCRSCHEHFDGYKDSNDDQRSIEFFVAILRTQQMLLENQQLVVR